MERSVDVRWFIFLFSVVDLEMMSSGSESNSDFYSWFLGAIPFFSMDINVYVYINCLVSLYDWT
jgi:hypothetical protein